nr:MAG TPA: hypothetical protein [Caudoviricetes sp.]
MSCYSFEGQGGAKAKLALVTSLFFLLKLKNYG